MAMLLGVSDVESVLTVLQRKEKDMWPSNPVEYFHVTGEDSEEPD